MTRQWTAIIRREGEGYVSLCPELDIASQGGTVTEARDNLQEALALFFETASPAEIERRSRDEVHVTRVEVPGRMIERRAAEEEPDDIRAVDVQPRAGCRIWLRYSDGAAGEVDLSHLAGKGVFRVWNDRDFFNGVHVSPHGSIAWDDEIELCPDALYQDLTGRLPFTLKPAP